MNVEVDLAKDTLKSVYDYLMKLNKITSGDTIIYKVKESFMQDEEAHLIPLDKLLTANVILIYLELNK